MILSIFKPRHNTPERRQIMTSMLFYVILFALWSIIPALIVATVLFLRGVAAEKRIEAMEMRKLDVDGVLSAIAAVKQDMATIQAKGVSLEESLSYLNAKWNARMRTEQQQEKKREKENKDNNGHGDLDVEQLQAFPVPSIPQTQKRRRQFGEFPQQ